MCTLELETERPRSRLMKVRAPMDKDSPHTPLYICNLEIPVLMASAVKQWRKLDQDHPSTPRSQDDVATGHCIESGPVRGSRRWASRSEGGLRLPVLAAAAFLSEPRTDQYL